MPDGILVTGASGFVGGQLMTRLADQPSVAVWGTVRAGRENDHSGFVSVGEINGDTDWSEALLGQRVIVHRPLIRLPSFERLTWRALLTLHVRPHRPASRDLFFLVQLKLTVSRHGLGNASVLTINRLLRIPMECLNGRRS